MLIVMDYWTIRHLNKEFLHVDVVYLVLKSLPHTHLLTKLQAYGICGDFHNWLLWVAY